MFFFFLFTLFFSAFVSSFEASDFITHLIGTLAELMGGSESQHSLSHNVKPSAESPIIVGFHEKPGLGMSPSTCKHQKTL